MVTTQRIHTIKMVSGASSRQFMSQNKKVHTIHSKFYKPKQSSKKSIGWHRQGLAYKK